MKQAGISFIEMLVVIVIAGILIGGTVPSLSQVLEYYKANSEIVRLQQSLLLAKSLSKSYRSRMTACPLVANSCDSDWQNGFSIFNDKNNNGALDDDESLLQQVEIDSNDYLYYSKTKISFNSLGQAGFSNGTLRFCSSAKQPEYPLQLIISTSGRIRKDDDADKHCDVT